MGKLTSALARYVLGAPVSSAPAKTRWVGIALGLWMAAGVQVQANLSYTNVLPARPEPDCQPTRRPRQQLLLNENTAEAVPDHSLLCEYVNRGSNWVSAYYSAGDGIVGAGTRSP